MRWRGLVSVLVLPVSAVAGMAVGLHRSGDVIGKLGWRSVPCTLERFEISASRDRFPAFRGEVRFHYEMDGKRYTGTRLWSEKEGTEDYEEISSIREALGHGDLSNVVTRCRVNRWNSADSALAGISAVNFRSSMVVILTGIPMLLVGLRLLEGVNWRTRRVRPDRDAAPFVIAILGTFFGGAGIVMLVGAVLTTRQFFDMKSWVANPAVTVWTRLVTEHSGRTPTTTTEHFYRYSFGGTGYCSDRGNLHGPQLFEKRGYGDAHPPGSDLTIYVDPAHPWKAVIDPGGDWTIPGTYLVSVLLMASGFGGMWGYFRWRNKRATSASTAAGPDGVASGATGKIS